MKNILFLSLLIFAVTACNFSGKKEASADKCCNSELKSAEVEYVTVEELLISPDNYVNKTVSLKGLCVHTCRHSGKKMFIQGTDEDQLVQVLADGSISGFEQELTGSQVIVTGLLTAKETEEHVHQEGEEHSCETESKSKSFLLNCTAYKVVEN